MLNRLPEQLRYKIPIKQELAVQDLTTEDLVNEKYIRKIVRTRIPGSTMKAQRGLFHGKKVRTRHRVTFSDKKTKLKQAPNVFKKTFKSAVLGKDIKVNVSSKALRCIRKYGGFDNYILLTKPKNLDSMFGEYLRKIMLEKLNNPELNLKRCKVFGTTADVWKPSRSKPKDNRVWMTKEVRHSDQTRNKFKGLNDMNKEELKLVSEYMENPLMGDEIFKKYSKFEENKEKIEEERKILKPYIDEVQNALQRKDKNKLRLYQFQVKDAQKYIKK